MIAEPGPLRGVLGRCAGCGSRFDVELKPRQDPFAMPGDADPLQAAAAESTAQIPAIDDVAEAVVSPSPFGASDPDEDARRLAAAVDLPRGFQLQTSGGRLAITWRWWNASHVFVLFFAAFWDVFMLVWYGIALSGGEWMMAAFGTAHALVGVGMSYYAVCGLLNHTSVTLTQSQVSVSHGPMPWPGSRALERSEVEQLYVSRQEQRNKNGVSVTYSLHVVQRDGAEVEIVRGLESSDQARFLESRIESALGIMNRPVPGEYRPQRESRP